MTFSTNFLSRLTLNVLAKLKSAGVPHPLDHRFVDAQRIGQRPYAPVRGVRRLGLGGPLNNHRGHLFSLGRLSASPWKVLLDSRQSLVNKSPPPSRHLARVNSQKLGNGCVWLSLF